MAIVAANGQDPNQQQQPNMGGSGTITGTPGASGGGGGSASVYQGSGASSAPRANPSGAPNIQDYLNANQGAGAKLTSGITNNYQNQANQYQQNLNSQQGNLSSQYDPLNSQVSQGQQYANTAFQNPQDLLNAYQSQQSQQAQGPNANTVSQTAAPDQTALQNYNNFQGDISGTQQNAQLQQGITGYQNEGQQAGNYLQAQLGQLGQTAALGANSMGQRQLLEQTVGTPNYTPGQQNLDSLFLQGNSNQLQNNLNGIYGQASTNTNNANQDYQTKLNALQQMAGQNNQYAQNLFLNGSPGQGGTGLNQIGANVQNEYNAAQQGQTASNEAWKNAAQGNYSPDVLAAMGLKNGAQTWGLNGQQLEQAAGYQQNALNAFNQGGAAQAAGNDEFSRYNALNKIAGGTGGQLQNSIFGTAQQAGGFSPYSLTNGTAGVQNAINTNAQLYGVTKVNDIIDQMRQAGYFSGQSGGSGMRAADPGAPYRQAAGAALGQLEQGSKTPGAADPNSYYQNVINALQGAWGSSGIGDITKTGGLDTVLGNYANTLDPMMAQRIGSIAGTMPKGSHGPMISAPGQLVTPTS